MCLVGVVLRVLEGKRHRTCLRRRLISGLLMSMVADPAGKLSLWDRKLDSTLLAAHQQTYRIDIITYIAHTLKLEKSKVLSRISHSQ